MSKALQTWQRCKYSAQPFAFIFGSRELTDSDADGMSHCTRNNQNRETGRLWCKVEFEV